MLPRLKTHILPKIVAQRGYISVGTRGVIVMMKAGMRLTLLVACIVVGFDDTSETDEDVCEAIESLKGNEDFDKLDDFLEDMGQGPAIDGYNDEFEDLNNPPPRE